MTKKSFFVFALSTLILITGCQKKNANLIQYVSPLIGTGPSSGPSGQKHNHGTEAWGQDIPAVSTPFAMTQWTPESRPGEKNVNLRITIWPRRFRDFAVHTGSAVPVFRITEVLQLCQLPVC